MTKIKDYVQNLNPIVSLLLYFMLIVCAFLPIEFTGLVFLFIIVFILSILVKVNFKRYLFIFINIIFLYLILLFFNMFIVDENPTLNWGIAFSLGKVDVYWYSFWLSFELAFRFFIFLAIGLLFSTVIKLENLTYAFRTLLYPLKYLRISIDDIAIILTLVVRFFPILKEDFSRLVLASSSREINFKLKPYLIITRFGFFLSFIKKLIEDSFERSEQISISMENRNYVPSQPRTYYEKHQFYNINYVCIILFILIFAFFIFMSVDQGNIIPHFLDPEYYYV